MLKALNILALVLVLTALLASCVHRVPMRGQFHYAYSSGGSCVFKAKHYAYNLWAAGYDPYLVIVDQGHRNGTQLHMLVTIDSVTYYDPSTLRVCSADNAGVIKIIYKFDPNTEDD